VLYFNDNEDYATRDGDWRRGTSFLDAYDVLGVELHDDNVAAGAIMKLFLKRRFGKVQGCSSRSPCKKAEASAPLQHLMRVCWLMVPSVC